MAVPPPPIPFRPNPKWLPTAGPKLLVTLSWQPSPRAASYVVRVEDLTVPSLRAAGNDCEGTFVCRNVTDTRLAILVRAGHAYRWTVQAVNAEGTSTASTATFRIDEPPVDPSFSNGLVQVFPLEPSYREIAAPSPPQWRVEVSFARAPEQQQQAFTIRGEVRDVTGKMIASGTTPLTAGTTVLTFAVPPLPEGRYTLLVGVYSPSNKLVEQEEVEYRVHRNAPTVRIAENGLLRRHSIPMFPLGFYMAGHDGDADFERMAGWGTNCGVSYSFGFHGYQTGGEQAAHALALGFLDRAHRNGIGIIYNLKDFYEDGRQFPDFNQRTGLELAHEYMGKVKDHPALLTYYTADEPNLGGRVDHMPKVLAMQQLVADYDANHPTWLVIVNGAKPIGDFHYRAADFLAVDVYPVPGYPIEWVEEATRGNAASARGVRPNWTVPQIHNGGNYPNLGYSQNEPTKQEKICMAMQALIGGATGVIFYSHFDQFTEVLPDSMGVLKPVDARAETLDRRFAEIAAITKHITSVIPALIAGIPQTLKPVGAATVRYRAIEHGGEMWVILANTTSGALTASYTLPAGTWGSADAPNGEVTGQLVNPTTLKVTVPARSGGTVRVERAGVRGARWSRMPDSAADVAAGPDGSVWITGTTPVGGGFDIRQFNGTGWTTVPGGAVRIAVGPTGPWVVNNGGSIYRRDGTRFTGLPGSAREIAVGSRGEAWIIGTNPVAGGFGISWWDGDEWRAVEGGGVRIAVEPRGTPWIIDSANRILRHNGVRWVPLPGAATEIAIGAEGTPWIIGTDPVSGGFGIYRWDGVTWARVDGGATNVTVGPDGLPWVVNNAAAIYRRVR